jgi:hypothetical protein
MRKGESYNMADSKKRGRLILTARPLSYFFGPDNVDPKEREIAFDDESKDLVLILEDPYGNPIVYNTVKELRDYITELKNSGIFTSAAAFVNNRKIYRFYFDLSNGTARIDPELTFDPLYRYYAIRDIKLGNDGEYNYVTGIQGQGSLEEETSSNLIDMNLEDNESGDGTSVSVPQVGSIIKEVIDGHTYIVEFFDSSRQLVNIIPFQAKAVRVADLDLSPDTAVVDMYIRTNRPMETNQNACFLYRGETPEKLEIRVYLKYADGRTRDITFENTTNGRLIIQGLDELSTDSITTEGNTIQRFNVVYTLIRDNSSLPSGPSETQEGAIINPRSLTISKEVDVYVLEDVFNNLEKVICAPYVETVTGNGNQELNGEKIRIKFFGLYESGAIYDITNICTYTNPGGLQENNFGVTQNIVIRVPYGNAGAFKTFNFDIICSVGSKQVKVNNQTVRLIEANRQSTAGFSGAFTKIGYVGTGNSISEVSLSALLNSIEVEFHNISPDYIVVRDIIDPTYNYTEIANSFGTSGIGYVTNQNHDIRVDKPVLVEFIKVNTDDGMVTNIFKTGALLHYVRIVDGV